MVNLTLPSSRFPLTQYKQHLPMRSILMKSTPTTTSIIEPNTKFLAIKVNSFSQEVVTTIPPVLTPATGVKIWSRPWSLHSDQAVIMPERLSPTIITIMLPSATPTKHTLTLIIIRPHLHKLRTYPQRTSTHVCSCVRYTGSSSRVQSSFAENEVSRSQRLT